MNHSYYQEKFSEFLSTLGIYDTTPIIDGDLHRTDGKTYNSGWYVARLITINSKEVLTGIAGDWNGGEKRAFEPEFKLNKKDAEEFAAEVRRQMELETVARLEAQKAAAEEAEAQWESAAQDRISQYFEHKGFGNSLFGCRVGTDAKSDETYVPMQNESGKLAGIQTIHGAGKIKRFLSGQQCTGAFHLIAGKEDSIYICEGVATGASIYLATKCSVFCALSANNLKAVASIVRKKHPKATITIAADNDHKTEGNPGVKFGRAAAEKINAKFVSPVFDSGSKLTDFNDLHQHTNLDEVRRQLEGAVLRKSIVINERQHRDITDDIWQSFATANEKSPKYFNANGSFAKYIENNTGELRILSFDSCFSEITKLANFKFKDKKGNLTDIEPRRDLARTLVADPSPTLPELEQLARIPVLTKQVELVCSHGFHHSSGIYLSLPPSMRSLDIPPKPSPEHVRDSKSLLESMIVDFNFENASSRANVFGAILTPFILPSVHGPAPMFTFEAQNPSAGKTLLAECVSLVVAGKAEMTPFASCDEEIRKKITSLLRDYPSMVIFDNAPEHSINLPSLAALLTSLTWQDRLLCTSSVTKFPNKTLWALTGNRMTFSRELSRRLAPISILAPSKKDFLHKNLIEWVTESRPKLVRAILTIIQGWIATGARMSAKKIDSYESYASIVDGVLKSIGISEFMEFNPHMTKIHPRGEWDLFCEAWWQQFGASSVKVKALHDLCRQNGLLVSEIGFSSSNDKSQMSKLGFRLKDRDGRTFDRYQITQTSNRGRNHGRLYALKVQEERGTYGDGSPRY